MRVTVVAFLSLYLASAAAAQQGISALPKEVNSAVPVTGDFVAAFNKLHLYSESICHPIRITRLDSTGWQPENLSDPRNIDR